MLRPLRPINSVQPSFTPWLPSAQARRALAMALPVLALTASGCNKDADAQQETQMVEREATPGQEDSEEPSQPAPAAKVKGAQSPPPAKAELAPTRQMIAAAPAPVESAKPAPPYDAQAVPADILGLRLGMKLPEVLAVLDKLTPKLSVDSQFGIVSSGPNPQVTFARADTPGRFSTTVTATTKKSAAERVTLMFALPPGENVVIDIKRQQQLDGFKPEDSLSPQSLWTALQGKYGPPAEKQDGSESMTAKWLYPLGVTDCLAKYHSWEVNGPMTVRCATVLTVATILNRGLVISIDSRLGNPRELRDSYDNHIDFLKNERAERATQKVEGAQLRPQL